MTTLRQAAEMAIKAMDMDAKDADKISFERLAKIVMAGTVLRKALAQQDRKCEADPYAELKAAARDPTKQVRLRGSEIWVEGDFYVFDEPPENYEIRNKPQKIKLLAYIGESNEELL
jgi:hypothetical protein